MLFFNYYYLVYKISVSDILWIVDESEYYKSFIDKIEDYQSNIDQYLIIKTRHSKFEMINIDNINFKRYRTFDLDSKSKIIYRT